MGKFEKIVTIGGLAAGFGGTVMMSYAPSLFPNAAQTGFWGGLALLCFGLAMIAWAVLHRKEKEAAAVGDDFSIKTGGIFGNFNPVGHVFHGPQQRKMDDGLRAQILRELPRDKPITVMGMMGDAESCTLALEIHAFLKGQGFNMAEPGGISQAVFNPPAKGLIVEPSDAGTKFIVGSR